ncbi:hypothetical protein HLH26_07320 [Gluconacetobacter sp. 1b LMG 1731]|uniref:Nucleotidyltransferase n=1 Tax=Gluconacetobacter dulcium TaxID=2729096 RepID=A0A7W4NUL8_9PROT|nr:hypothetical protein [Gluconacetobacter dulcium]MBB2164353.1 hypothetical protein [Gluconacetobacter dulcium]MBB2193577.1 hypothetical protein [Gluconacetobacter dulcium]
MSVPEEFLAALEPLGRACATYREITGTDAVLVGGAATVIYTDGAFNSSDFDLVALDDPAFNQAMTANGFKKEDRPGHLLFGFYHPEHPLFGFQAVSGPLFDGRADRRRLCKMALRDKKATITLPAIEDMIADRLAQHAVASPGDSTRLEQARALFALAFECDEDYLRQRVNDEGGDFALLRPDP